MKQRIKQLVMLMLLASTSPVVQADADSELEVFFMMAPIFGVLKRPDVSSYECK